MQTSTLAIVSAMHEELRALLPQLQDARRVSRAGREFHSGQMYGHPVVLVLSGVGKVSAATTVALLASEFKPYALLFTGVAGGLGAGVCVGDVVLARELLQHDMDASPLFPRYEVPFTGRSRFPADTALSDTVAAATTQCLDHPPSELSAAHLAEFGITQPRLHEGMVISGDRFIATSDDSAALQYALPDALAVEMEGAAVAQVCADIGLPFALLRVISDRADDSAHIDFPRFMNEVAGAYTHAIVAATLARL
ncbi:MAG: 5'-methylthioadenosine/adenosylhomocysteine nucleosidase [Burkholderiaceae bacterium]|nr:5'-methylthioadenosine/adenosylhomocysteine nucleosidase [Burkholderiaceae bacterium]